MHPDIILAQIDNFLGVRYKRGRCLNGKAGKPERKRRKSKNEKKRSEGEGEKREKGGESVKAKLGKLGRGPWRNFDSKFVLSHREWGW